MMTNQQIMMWLAVLTSCDGTGQDMSEQSEEARICADQMRHAGILDLIAPDTYVLSSQGHRLLMLLLNLCKYSLGID